MNAYTELCLDFPAEIESIRGEAHEFANEIVRPAAIKLDGMSSSGATTAADSPLREVLKAAYGLGYHRAAIPERLGGLGLSGLGLHSLFEELGWGSAGIAISLAASMLPAQAALADGRAQIVDAFVKEFAANRDASWIGCWALSEPRHGSDHFMVGTREFRYPAPDSQLVARPDGDHFIVDGRKASWVTNGGIATHALCSVLIEHSRSSHSFVVVPLELAGVTRGEAPFKIGQREMNQGALFFENVRVPHELMLKGQGYEQEVERLLALAHSTLAAIMTGTARAAYEEALKHSKQRRQGGSRICDHQVVQQSLFEMFTRVEASRALSRAAMIYNWGAKPVSMETAIAAKIFCTRGAFEVANRAVQIFGADGFSKGNLIEKLFRDARVSLVEEGVNEALEIAGALRLIQ